MPSIPGGLTWDPQDRLQKTDHQGGGVTYYVYDSAGMRVRKVHLNQAATTAKERYYLGPWETYRETTDLQGTPTLDLERETLHVDTPAGAVVLLETKTVENATALQNPTTHHRYQHQNHLGTATLELSEDAEVITYEEYHPYGTSSYRAANAAIDVSPKRYRYTGKERDEETGLYYHEARYYGCWLGRWTAADPIGLQGGINRFAYANSNPLTFTDPAGTSPQHIVCDDDVVSSKAPPPSLVTTGRGLAGAGSSTLPVEGDPQFEPADLSVKDTGPANGPEYIQDWDAWGRDVRQKADSRAGTSLKGTAVLLAAGGAAAIAGLLLGEAVAVHIALRVGGGVRASIASGAAVGAIGGAAEGGVRQAGMAAIDSHGGDEVLSAAANGMLRGGSYGAIFGGVFGAIGGLTNGLSMARLNKIADSRVDVYRFATLSNPGSLLPNVSSSSARMRLKVGVRMRVSRSWLERRAAQHSQGLTNDSPFVSTTENVEAFARSTDPWAQAIRTGYPPIFGTARAPDIMKFSVPRSSLVYPGPGWKKYAFDEMERLFIGDTLERYMVTSWPNPY
ncbi:MAG TPA: RHS repeat-associated core domain-containing protein [Nannocystaceae bacterium]|nr:RHS repeat-associated core domain-containing protein [Nannocystaceae bacterium]